MSLLAHDRRSVRRAYALPLVLMLLLVAGIMVATMLERHATQAALAHRQLVQYVEEHVGRGMREACEAWIKGNGPNEISEALASDGRAFTLEIQGGQKADVYFTEMQGRLLADLSGLHGDALAMGRDALLRLRQQAGGGWERFLRREGPLAVGVNSASPEVLAAIVGAATEDEGTDEIVDNILAARGQAPIDAERLTQLLLASSLTQEQQARVARVLTVSPGLWWILAEARRPPGDLRPPIRYGGFALIGRLAGSPAERMSGVRRSTTIVSWERLPDADTGEATADR